MDHLSSDDLASPLQLGDRLLRLAAAADRAGYTHSARGLLSLAYAAYDEKPRSLPAGPRHEGQRRVAPRRPAARRAMGPTVPYRTLPAGFGAPA